VRQTRIQPEREVAGTGHLFNQFAQALGQSLAAIRGIGVERAPAAGYEGSVGFLESFRGSHHAVLEVTALGVAAGVERQQCCGDEPGGFVQDGVHQVRRDFFKPWQTAEARTVVEFVQHEAHVAQRRGVRQHYGSPIPKRLKRLRFVTRGRTAGRRSSRHPATRPEKWVVAWRLLWRAHDRDTRA
jgi:hypothetical protein